MRTASTLLSDSFALFKERFSVLLSIFIIPGLLSALFNNFLINTSRDSLLYGVDLSSHNLDLILRSVLGIVIGLLSLIMGIAIIKATQSPVTVKEAYAFACQKFGSYFLVSMMAGFIIILGLVLFIIPGIVFITWFLFATYVVLFENKFGVDALKASKAYVEGKVPLILGRFVFGVIAIGLLGVFTGILLNFLLLLPSTVLNVPVVSIMVDLLTNAIMTPLILIYMYLMYVDVKNDYLAKQTDQAPVSEAPNVTASGV